MTTTMTLLETYDAQMLDYPNDSDIQMHPSTSTDLWFQEAPMEDDGHIAYQSKAAMNDPETTPSIEIDMDGYEEVHFEYDMTDEQHQAHNLAAGEVLDVDLLDASAVPTPLAAGSPLPLDTSVEYPQQHQHGSHTPLPSIPDSSSSISLPVAQPDHYVGSSAGTNPPVGPATVLQESVPESVIPQVEEGISFSTPSFAHEGVPSHPTVTTISDSNLSEYHYSRQGSEQHSAVSPHITETAEDRASSKTPIPLVEPANNSSMPGDLNHPEFLDSRHQQVESHTSAASEISDANRGTDPNTHALREHQVEGGNTAEPDVEHRGTVEPTEHVAVEGEHVEIRPHTEHDPPQQGEVLHEEPEETYLETPPIYLSIFSTDRPELCLFNKPSEPLPEADDTQEIHILLQHAPSLYYEPMANVFETLRQDEYVSTVLDTTGNELAFDAYNLELVISEDNIFAREISLQDMHALHESLNLAGPLRLRLFVIGPRFISRYHALQEGLVNLRVDETHVVLTTEEPENVQTEETQTDTENAHLDYADTEAFQAAEQGHPEHTESQFEEDAVQRPAEVNAYYDDETAEDGGEIDLSTLPPFVDSPEPRDEEQGDEGEEYAYTEEGSVEETRQPLSDVVALPGQGSKVDELSQEPEDEGHDQHSSSEFATAAFQADQLGELAPIEAASHEGAAEHDNTYGEDEETAILDKEDSDVPPPAKADEADGGSSNQIDENEQEKTPQPEDQQSRLEPTDLDSSNLPDGHEHEHDEHEQDEYDAQGASEHDVQEIVDDEFSDVQAAAPVPEPEADDFEAWDDELDGEGDPDTTWEAEQEESASNHSSVTLSSKASKRSFDDIEDDYLDGEDLQGNSPGLKRARVE